MQEYVSMMNEDKNIENQQVRSDPLILFEVQHFLKDDERSSLE